MDEMKHPKDMTRDELVKLAQSVGLTVDPHWSTSQLINRIAQHRMKVAPVADRQALIQRATRFGVMVPKSWSNERIEAVLDSLDTAASSDPEWTPGSPRG